MKTLAPHAFSLRQLQYAVAVADSLSFGRAASFCNVSQPSLSAQLAQLEEALGVRLFERDRRRVLLTTAGKELVERARNVLDRVEDLVAAAARVGDPLSGTLRLGVIPTVSPYLLPVVTPALRRAYPRLSVVWLEDKTDVLMKRMQDGAIDAALVALEADLGDVDKETIARDVFVLATAAKDPLGTKAAAATPAELRDASVLLLDDGHCFREQALALCERAKAHELEFRATSLTTLAQMVAGGAGVTLLPQLAVATEARRCGLRIRRFAEPCPGRTICLVWRKTSPCETAFRAIARTMREAYPREAPPTRNDGTSRRRRRARPARAL
jgi:LysR family hydrogen peroxide-inducible transcriptional activator